MAQELSRTIMRIRYILLHLWDPIGISSYEGASDEYDVYADHVAEMMKAGADVDSIREYLYDRARNDIGLDYAGLIEKSEVAAREIVQSEGKIH